MESSVLDEAKKIRCPFSTPFFFPRHLNQSFCNSKIVITYIKQLVTQLIRLLSPLLVFNVFNVTELSGFIEMIDKFVGNLRQIYLSQLNNCFIVGWKIWGGIADSQLNVCLHRQFFLLSHPSIMLPCSQICS